MTDRLTDMSFYNDAKECRKHFITETWTDITTERRKAFVSILYIVCL